MPGTKPTTVYLPNGFVLTVTPSFGGMVFKTNEFNQTQHPLLPPGWSIVIYSADEQEINLEDSKNRQRRSTNPQTHHSDRSLEDDALFKGAPKRFTKPTLNRDSFFISSVFYPSSSDGNACSSLTRQTALMIWATLYWYFHLPAPDVQVTTRDSILTPESGRPKGPWRIYVKREGVLKGRNLMSKLERMGLLATEDSSVGLEVPAISDSTSGWSQMFMSRRSFWQIDPRIFLFSWRLEPNPALEESSPILSPSHTPSPHLIPGHSLERSESPKGQTFSRGPFYSSSNLPTYFPPPPPQYIFTDGVRHPIRPKPPRQGEIFYNRYIPSVKRTLSFRVPILPPPKPTAMAGVSRHRKSSSVSSLPLESVGGFGHREIPDPLIGSDIDVLHRWMNSPRVDATWGVAGPQGSQVKFLKDRLLDRHLFPALGCWDEKPFGYFEIYWIKEDNLGRLIGGSADDWDRGLRFLAGNDEDRTPDMVHIWASALVHHCFLADSRTNNIMVEPRIDSEQSIASLQRIGFFKEGEVTLPQKQSAVMKLKRDVWESPAL